MIKRCPDCNRTYSDESISFCLADGALLSAPFDRKNDEAPPTEIFSAEDRPVASSRPIPPTEPPKPPVPTMTSLGGQNYTPFKADRPEPKRSSSGRFIWASIVLLVVAVIVIGIFGVRRVLNRQTDETATSSPDPSLAQDSPGPTDSPQVTSTSTAETPANPSLSETKTTSSPQADAKVTSSPALSTTLKPDPVLIPPTNNQTNETKQSEQTDYNRVFSQSEVDTKVQLLAKPKPSYTDSARQNNVQGTVRLRVVFSADGSVGNVSPIQGLSHGLTEQAIAAARRINFVPARKDGRPVSVAVTVEYNFSVY